MSQLNKLYRNFIILQEDERGYSNSNDKTLSGYSKIEAKGDRCKISFYAQNLRSESDDYCIMAICNKKDTKRIVDLGKITVSDEGKAEVTKEYSVDNIAGLGLSYDKISGAAIAKMKNEIPIIIMCGFINGEQPNDNWKNYKIVKSTKDHLKSKSEYIKKDDKKKEKKCNEHREEDIRKEKPFMEEVQNNNSANIENDFVDNIVEENELEKSIPVIMKSEYSNSGNPFANSQGDINPFVNKESEVDYYGLNRDSEKNKFDEYEEKIEEYEGRIKEYEEKIEEYEVRIEEYKEYGEEIEEYEETAEGYREAIEEYKEYEEEIEEASDTFAIRGSVGEYFESIASGFECCRSEYQEIKYCKWYKIPVNDLHEMCNMSNYNRYTIAYYPMLNYYPYIRKYGHFMLGYKCDKEGNLKYIVYGIPGEKNRDEQPYEGKTGFVTWISNETRDGMGCWLMFYDFRNSTVVVPMK